MLISAPSTVLDIGLPSIRWFSVSSVEDTQSVESDQFGNAFFTNRRTIAELRIKTFGASFGSPIINVTLSGELESPIDSNNAMLSEFRLILRGRPSSNVFDSKSRKYSSSKFSNCLSVFPSPRFRGVRVVSFVVSGDATHPWLAASLRRLS